MNSDPKDKSYSDLSENPNRISWFSDDLESQRLKGEVMIKPHILRSSSRAISSIFSNDNEYKW